MRPCLHIALALLLLAAGVGCGPKPGSATTAEALSEMPAPSDAPFELADDQDLETLRDRYDAIPLQDPERAGERRRLADEYARRIDEELEEGERRAAFESLLDLLSLWAPSELDERGELASELRRYAPQAQAIRDTFARSGGDREATAALIALRAMKPAGAQDYTDEIEEIFAYTDDLAVARYGEGAQRSRPIEILELVGDKFPSPFVVDRLTELYLARQEAIDAHFKRNGADFQIIRAHGQGVLRTSWNIARTHARAHRLEDAAAILEEITGLGDNPDLRRSLQSALAEDAEATSWVRLSAEFRAPDSGSPDLDAAYAVCLEAARRFPKHALSHLCAGKNADDLGAYLLAIRHYERGLELEPAQREAASRLAALYEFQVTRLALGDRPRAARQWLTKFEDLFKTTSRRFDQPIEPDVADAYAAMGRGLVSLGELDRARSYLDRSLELRPTLTALEYLGTVALKQERFEEAQGYYQRALDLEVGKIEKRFDRNKILRLSGEAYEGMGELERAKRSYTRAMRRWGELRRQVQLSRTSKARAEVERGKLYWKLDKRQRALDAFERAVDLDPDGASTHADVVSFLIVRGEYDRTLDAYHRALGSHEIGDYYKVYMSLWVLAEARRRGEPEDQRARDYLAGRDGRLWYDHLARYASGRIELKPLEEQATTRGRRAELLYYAAVLGEEGFDPAEVRDLLERVLATEMVLFFEYEMARHWLARGFADSEPTAQNSR